MSRRHRALLCAPLLSLAVGCAARRQPPRPAPPVVDAGVPDAIADARVDAVPPDAALPLTVPADVQPIALDPAALAAWRAEIDRGLSAAGASGWASVVVVGDAVVDRAATGRVVDPGHGPLAADTARPLGPLTRVVTGLLIAALIEEGHLDWSAPVTRLRRDWPAAGQAPTMTEMACGCFGIAAVPGTPPRTPQQVLERLEGHLAAGDTLEAMPTPVLTAAAGYLAALGAPSAPIEPGAAYVDQVAERVAEPLGLALTIGAPDAPGVVPVFAPDSGAWASIDDLARLAVALQAGGLTPSGGRVVEGSAIAAILARIDGQSGGGTRAGFTLETRGALIVRSGGGATRGGVTRMVLAGGLAWAVRVEGRGAGVTEALEAGLDDLLARRYGLRGHRAPAPIRPMDAGPPDSTAAKPDAAPAPAATPDAAP